MQKIRNTIERYRRCIALYLVAFIIIGMLPISYGYEAIAAPLSMFTVEFDNSVSHNNTVSGNVVSGNCAVTLTNSDNASESETVLVSGGDAIFSDFVDTDLWYDISVTGLIGLRDYYKGRVKFSGNQITFSEDDFISINSIIVSGTITDEEGNTYEGGGTVSCTGYQEKSVSINEDGEFSIVLDKNQSYDFTFTPTDPKYNVVSMGNINRSSDVSDFDAQLTIKTFSVTTSSGDNGTITSTDSAVLYGSDKEITVTADTNYRIASLTIDGRSITDAVGLRDFVYEMEDIRGNHTLYATFVIKTWEINVSFNQNGNVQDWLTNQISSGGTIVANEGENPGFTAIADTNYHVGKIYIDGLEKEDGTFDNAQDEYSHTFSNIQSDHEVIAEFSINTFEIDIDSSQNGQVSGGDVSDGITRTLSYGSSLSFVLTPATGYDVAEVRLDNAATDEYQLMDDGISYSYQISDIDADHTVFIDFDAIVEMGNDETDYYQVNTVSLIDDYPTVSGNDYVYNFINSNASLTITPKSPYTRMRINGRGNQTSYRYTDSALIQKIEVYKPQSPGRGWGIVPLEYPLQIIIDKTAPTVASIAPMEWTNQDYTISGTVSDNDPGPYSGLSRVVWSKEPITTVQVLDEETNITPIVNRNYSFTISTEENNEPYYIYAIDNANNVSQAQTINLKIDKTKPTITNFSFSKIEPPFVSSLIRFLSFGTFYHNAIKVTIQAQDSGISSGLNEITLYSDGEPIDTKRVTGNSAVFTLSMSDYQSNEISASVTDIAGNISTGLTEPLEASSNVYSNIVSLKTEIPTISIVPAQSPLYEANGEGWYDQNVRFQVTAKTLSGGIYSVSIKLNGEEIETDKNGKEIDADFFTSQTLEEVFTISTDQNPLDGENVLEVTVVNVYGNQATARHTVFIDTTNPQIVGFSIDKENNNIFSKILHFLTFGNFFHEKVRITIIADDQDGASAKMGTVTLYTDGTKTEDSPKTLTPLDNGTYKAEFVIPESLLPETKEFDQSLSVVATDNVGNITGKDATHLQGVPVTLDSFQTEFSSSRLLIETVSPTIEFTLPEEVYQDDEGRVWYAEDLPFTVEVQDADAGIRSVEVNINGEAILTDVEGKSVNQSFYLNETHEEIFQFDTSQGTRGRDGEFFIEVTVTDNAGNTFTDSETVYMDIDQPYITGYQFIPASTDGIGETSEFMETLEYGYYFKTGFTAIIKVEDPEPTSGLDRVFYRLVSYQNNQITGEQSGILPIRDGAVSIDVPQGFKGQIYAEAIDFAGNMSPLKTPRGFVVDSTLPTIEIKYNSETPFQDAKGNDLFVSDISVTVVISDVTSGLREIRYSQTAELESYEQRVIQLQNTGYSVGSEFEDGWHVTRMDHNLVTEVTNTFIFNKDDNDILLNFDALDRSGNGIGGVASEPITLDKTNPIINIDFREDESKNELYYSQNRVADITVTERNFNPDLILTTIENTYGNVPSFTFTEVSNTVHTAVIDFDEGDYTFDLTGTDMGELIAEVNFSGGNENLFYVDKTQPVIEDNFTEFIHVDSENSFNTDKTITIQVTEHNFNPAAINLRVTRKGAGEEHNTAGLTDVTEEAVGENEWETNGDQHEISFTLHQDAIYRISIAPIDLAENSADSKSTVIFEIDQTAPVVVAKNGRKVSEDDLEFLDIYPYARKDEPIPTVEFDDLNIDHIEYDLTVYIPDQTHPETGTIVRPVKESGIVSGTIITLPEFTRDGVYALELTAVDVAGNKSLLNQDTYARMVDQDVLAYISNSNLAQKTGLYSFQYEDGKAISMRPDSFSDIEIVVLSDIDTGVDILLRDNNADEVNTNAQANTNEGIYGIAISNFVLEGSFFKENFQDDTDKELYLTVDNEGNRIDLGRMHIDNIVPSCDIPEELHSWNWFRGDEDRNIIITNIEEQLDESKCKVYDQGLELPFDYSQEDNTLEFTLTKGWHDIGIVLTDMAGNENVIQEMKQIHVGDDWWGMIGGTSTAAVGAGVWITLRNYRIRRRMFSE